MFKRFRLAMAKILIGDNLSMLRIYERMRASGRYISAIAAVLLLQPVRKFLDANCIFGKYDFVMSPDYYRQLHSLLHISRPEGFELVRLGRDNDGGYIMLDDFGRDDGIAYSFGISTDVSWDKDMASRGYDVFMYDHTIEALPEENPRFHFFRQGIADGKIQDDRLKTLEELIAHNHHEGKRNMILKMDVEGAEWGFLEHVKPETLAQFSQMVFEFHSLINPANTEQVLATFRKINMTHRLIHAHANNYAEYMSLGGKNFPIIIELTYAINDKYSFDDNYDPNLPLDIDIPNNESIPEVELGHWNREINPDDTAAAIIAIK